MPLVQLTAKDGGQKEEEKICFFAQTNFRNQLRRFGIKTDDRRRHMYVIGKTGMGKTTMMENMVLHDIYNGHGVGIVDPHGDFAEKIIDYIPSHRINDVVYFNPADVQYPIGFNILEVKNEEQKHLVSAGLMATFKKIWPDVWSSRMEYILNNTLLALLDYPNSTLLGINRLLSDKKYRAKVVKKLTDPVVKAFWETEFAGYNDRYAQEAVAPIQNKIGQFLSASVIRNMVAQVKSTIHVRDIMDGQKILIMNLSKGRIGEDNSRLIGGMLITKIQLAAMERVDTPERDRKDFFLYVDEFQNFATPSFANILSEARKYRLSLIMAHQYVAQLDEVVADAVFGNVGTIVTFRVGGSDAEMLVKEFTPHFTEEDIVNLAKYQVFLKLMIDGVASLPFSAATMPPIGSPTGSTERVVRVSRERYAKNRESIEDKIMRWSGLEIDEDDDDDDDLPLVRFDGSIVEKHNDRPSSSVSRKDARGPKNVEPDKRIDMKQVKKEDLSPVVLPVPEESLSLSSLLPREEKRKEDREEKSKQSLEEKSLAKEVPSGMEKEDHDDEPEEGFSRSFASLASLLPKESAAEEEPEEKSEPVEEKQDETSPVIEPPEKKQHTINIQPLKPESRSDAQKTSAPPEQKNQSLRLDQPQPSDDPERKKKRKRRRRKKKHSGESPGGSSQEFRPMEQRNDSQRQERKESRPEVVQVSRPAQQQERKASEPNPERPLPPIPAPPPSKPPEALSPDQVIRFDDDKKNKDDDWDDAWRYDK